ncbi:hypothetical protein UFOVP46_44 [uncultured Caudovirales phage]|uniref:Uncharacterized protein n=1 Tax=uncultured Caudovirales phage TaxID=2100421 RepID=A0A6J5KTU3_9CAUD|nr:hypothetical protein UFOVP46_44 [uncultured Caudovirales phage]
MAKLIEEEGTRFEDPNSLEAQIREYVKAKSVIDIMDARVKELREKIFARLDEDGFEDDKGNVQLPLDNDIEGVLRLEKQRRVTRKLNEPKADEILTARGIKNDVYVMREVLEEDLLMAAFYEDKITEDELDEMFPANVTWALRTLKK